MLKFDSGFMRELTLSASDSISRTIVRAPQPETVKSYSVLIDSGGSFKPIATVAGNHQRLNRLRFEPVETSAVRIHVRETNGIEEARIFEVRCYG